MGLCVWLAVWGLGVVGLGDEGMVKVSVIFRIFVKVWLDGRNLVWS